jgi:hypothetical protein
MTILPFSHTKLWVAIGFVWQVEMKEKRWPGELLHRASHVN